tara:strand:+ start:1064 stop:1255 length:192 start_codon:yes stop_codon:yes gene_type:complete
MVKISKRQGETNLEYTARTIFLPETQRDLLEEMKGACRDGRRGYDYLFKIENLKNLQDTQNNR